MLRGRFALNRILAVIGIVAMAAGLVLGTSGGSTSAQVRIVWSQVMGIPSNASLQDVYMLDPHTAYIAGSVGASGIIYRMAWTGTQWQISGSQLFRAPLKAIVAVADDNVWAVGDQGLVLHKDSNGWAEMPGIPSLAYFTTLQMLGDGSEGWAGGVLRYSTRGPNGDPLMMHYRNGQWQRDNSVSFGGGINSLHFAPGGGWAVGTSIWRFQGNTWTQERPPSPCGNTHCTAVYNSIRAVSDQEAWFVGFRQEECGKCKAQPYALHKIGSTWQRVIPDFGFSNWKINQNYSYNLKGVAFYGDFGFMVGVAQEPNSTPLVLTNRDGKWSRESLPVQSGNLNKVSMRDASHAMAVGPNGLVLAWGYWNGQPTPTSTPVPAPPPPTATPAPGSTPPPTPNPAQRVADPHQQGVLFFPEVGHTLRGTFSDYWLSYGGLQQFGYPLTEQFVEVSPTNGRPYTVQYFERARFESHPENQPPYKVLLGLLGRTITQGREREPAFLRAQEQIIPGFMYFAPTGHNIPVQFSDYWQSNGGLAVYGYPISEAFTEISPTDGKPYLVQYFERNRLEYHPELPQQYRVSLGLLGAQVLRQKGWIR